MRYACRLVSYRQHLQGPGPERELPLDVAKSVIFESLKLRHTSPQAVIPQSDVPSMSDDIMTATSTDSDGSDDFVPAVRVQKRRRYDTRSTR